MNLTEIDDGVFTCGQITEDFVDELAKAGFKTIICNRPDNEEENQPGFSTIEKAAKAHGLDSYYIPVTPPHITSHNVDEMKRVLNKCEYPVLAYCKSGHRAETLYHLAKN
ncbi:MULTISPECIES: TIGR01244 family sulfur transferase [Bartonella]|uniref:TIGR01244 family sulfur transferase n=1 Tax=Bartonella TaxID=773 RepID=UPI0018DE8321|nr:MULTISPECIES: TIGR01244 family sulfur transferase [Bartonella]MBH9974351.1 TIGR01244 family phosphatase [Bartonella choladocola]MBI0013958.1 TIGR01244 family phosphatase [Bartonella sp. B10834G3]MBI0139994.1 TIGR01244 family phosphatase [Bartonella choladocola]